MNEILNQVLHSFNGYELTIRMILSTALFVVGIFAARAIFLKVCQRVIPDLNLGTNETRKVKKILNYLFLTLFVLIIVIGLKLNPTLVQLSPREIKLSTIIFGIGIMQFAWFLDVLLYRILIPKYEIPSETEGTNDRNKAPKKKVSNYFRYLIYLLAVIFLLKYFQLDYSMFSVQQDDGGALDFRITKILFSISILLIAPIAAWLISTFIIDIYYRRSDVDKGFQFSINQLIKYVLYIFALFIAVENLGMKMTVIWGGAAALLVGVGLGLQQTFNDFFSGILLLFERSVQVGDVVNLDGMIATVKRIGLRTSLLETRESVSIIVPNSKLVTNNVINWSYYDQKARFWITVGVAYGSDTELVKKLLIESAKRQEAVLAYPKPLVRFVDFADSSLNFELHFWTTRFMYIEDLKSDIRFEVDKVFRANDIQIPFPQRDVWMRK